MRKRTAENDNDVFDKLLREMVKDPPFLLLPGSRLKEGRFVIKRRLGSGGTGVVYDAVDTAHDTRVVIKTLLHLSGDDLYQLKQEFRSLADTSHPNLVTLYELFIDDKNWFYTMEPVDGVDFVTYVENHPNDTARLADALGQLCDGLAVIHNCGKVHRDIKPSNVLVTNSGRVAILDFGMISDVSKESSHQSKEGIYGTLAYMSPEQALSEPASPAADWYSVGVMLYQCLCGQRPFDGKNVQNLLMSQEDDPSSPTAINPRANRKLSDLAMMLLAKDPSDRPDATAIRTQISGIVSSAPSIPPLPEEETHFVGRNHELKCLKRAWETANSESALVVTTVQGASGIGKSALVEHFTSSLRKDTPRPLVLKGRCFERESVPYKAFDALVDGMTQFLLSLDKETLMFILPKGVRYAAALFPVLERVEAIQNPHFEIQEIPDPNERRKRGAQTFCRLTKNISRFRPLVLIIDDLQWSDDDSLMLIREMISTQTPETVFLILLYRDEVTRLTQKIDTLVTDIPPSKNLSIHLSPLDETSAFRLVSEIMENAGQKSDPRSETLVTEAKGNPYYLLELSRLMVAAGAPNIQIKGGLSQVVARRFDGLTDLCKRLLRLIAVAGDALPRPLLMAAVGQNEDSEAFNQALITLKTEHLIRHHGPRILDAVVPSHDKVREAVLEITDEETTKEYHRLLAEAAEVIDQKNADLLARHFIGAGHAERAYRHVLDAAKAADTKLAFDRAADLYRTALSLTKYRPERVILGTALGDALTNAGHPGEAADAYYNAAADAEPRERIVLLRRAAQRWLRGGYINKGIDAIHQVVDQMGIWRPDSEWGVLVALVYHRLRLKLRDKSPKSRKRQEIPDYERIELDTLYTLGTGLDFIHPTRSQYFLLRFALKALDHDDERITSLALSWIQFFNAAYAISKVGADKPFFDIQEDHGIKSQYKRDVVFRKVVNSYMEVTKGHWQTTIDDTNEALDYLQSNCLGMHRELARLRWCQGIALLHQGSLKKLNTQVNYFLSDALSAGDKYARANFLSNFPIVWLANDDLEQTKRDIDDLFRNWAKGYHTLVHCLCVTAMCEHALYRGSGERALNVLESHLKDVIRSRYIKVVAYRVYLAMHRARAALMAASQTSRTIDRNRFIKTAKQMAVQLDREQLGYTSAWSALIRTGIHALQSSLSDVALFTHIDNTIQKLENASCCAYAVAAKRQKGLILGGDNGDRLVQESNNWFANQGVKIPFRFADMLVPPFESIS